MHGSRRLVVVVVLLLAPACYHATIDTGLAPSLTTVEKPWAPSFIGGLVPPNTVETQGRCATGVSKVETQLSFLNMLVGVITFGIFTPMDIKVTCAQAGRSSLSPTAPTIDVGANATAAQILDAISRAAELSLRTGVDVYVEY